MCNTERCRARLPQLTSVAPVSVQSKELLSIFLCNQRSLRCWCGRHEMKKHNYMGCLFWRLGASCYTGGWSGSFSAHTVASFFITLLQKKEKERTLFHIHRWSKFLPKLNYFSPALFSPMFSWRRSDNVCIILQTNVMEQKFLLKEAMGKQGCSQCATIQKNQRFFKGTY